MLPNRKPKDRLYFCGYWVVPGNVKRSHHHYSTHTPGTLDLIAGSDLVFQSNDPRYIDHVSDLAAERGIGITTEIKAIEDLPAWDLAEAMLQACRRMKLDQFARSPDGSPPTEKGAVHYWRDLKGSGPDTYRKILAIWLSKVDLTADVAAAAGDGRETAWMDISVSRFNHKRDNYDFRTIDLPSDRLSHYSNVMRYYDWRLPLNASFLSACPEIWRTVATEFSEAAARASEMPYGHDEETVLADCVWRRPELFHLIDPPPMAPPRGKASLGRRVLGELERFARLGRARSISHVW